MSETTKNISVSAKKHRIAGIRRFFAGEELMSVEYKYPVRQIPCLTILIFRCILLQNGLILYEGNVFHAKRTG